MSSRRGGGSGGAKLTSVAATGSSKGKNVLPVFNTSADHLASGMAATSLGSQQDGVWKDGRKPRNRFGGKGTSRKFNEKVMGNTGTGEKGNVGGSNVRNQMSFRGYGNNYGQPGVTPHQSYMSVAKENTIVASSLVDDDEDSEENANDIYDSDECDTDEYDTDESQKSHESRKKKEHVRKVLVLLQPLMSHAKTRRKGNVKVHRELAELLEEELRIRGTSVIPAGVAFGKWRGLKENVVRDKEIVWPPMVIIKNTLLEQDDDGQWLGMGNAELLEYFSAYEAVSSKHSYGPKGHRGMSLLIFESSAIGFIEAEQLSKHFEDEGIGKEAWDHHRVNFIPGGQRQLYGYMAEKRDLESFNQHSRGKPLQKFEMRSYQEVVSSQLKQMSEDNHLLLLWYKNKVEKLKKELEVLKGSFDTVTEKMRKVSEENRIVRLRTKLHHKEIKEEMDEQEEFSRSTVKVLDDARKEMEEKLQKIQQEHEGTKQYMETPLAKDRQSRYRYIYAEERNRLLKKQEQRRAELRRQQYEEKIKLEEELNAELAQLVDKHNPH
ncbi:hypothetical protein DCAR_0310864 [Daucus carota subsp. sativus]|uniref:XS domain-containing protein n=1 Tax=Daucus carota subsp. sativus TaxID=79200 RepID=A0AAF0WP64_DAUCS|nr:hypothetical protein DCAR_0310864 [Daucus carota subsp. sativus]